MSIYTLKIGVGRNSKNNHDNSKIYIEELLRDLSSSGPDGYAELTVAGADEENVQYVLKEKRLRQSLLSRGAADAVDELSSTAQTEEVPVPLQRGVFIAGDLNSMPSTAAIEFLTT